MQENNTTGYKQTSIGLIPTDWEVKKFNENATFFSGGTPLTSIKEYYNGEIPFIKSGEIYFDKTEQFISQDGFNNSSAKMISTGDLLYALYGANSGEVAIAKLNGAINQAILCIKPTKNLHTYFIYNFLLNKKETIIKNYLQGGQGNLSAEIIKNLLLPIPPLPEQQKIATILSTWDAAIDNCKAIIQKLQQRNKGLAQQLLTGKMRVKGFEETKWKKKQLSNYLVKHEEKSTINNQYPILTSSRRGLFLQSEYYTRDVASEDNTGYNVVPRGYFTYRHMSDDLIFRFNINGIVDKGIVSTLYPVFTIKDINKYFLLFKLNFGNEFKIHALEQKQGGSRTYIYFKTLCELKIDLPEIEEQDALVNVLDTATTELNQYQQQLQNLQQQKKGLMQQLLTGKVRVKI